MASTSCSMWLETMTVLPLAPNSLIKPIVLRLPIASIPLSGSSRNSKSGFGNKAAGGKQQLRFDPTYVKEVQAKMK